MRRGREAFVGIDTAKAKNAVTVAEGGRQGELRYLGEFDTAAGTVARLVRKLADRYQTLLFCYEAGPTGYGLYRQIVAMGYDCTVVAPIDDPAQVWRACKDQPAGCTDIGAAASR